MQRERVEDQYPWTWEIPLAVVCAIVVLGVAVCQASRSFANWFAGAGWRWPPAGDLVKSLPGLLAGDAAAGLSGVHPVASSGILWAWLGVTGLLTTTLLTVAGVWAWHRWGPARMRGMATLTRRSRNSYMRSPRRVTLWPTAAPMPSRRAARTRGAAGSWPPR